MHTFLKERRLIRCLFRESVSTSEPIQHRKRELLCMEDKMGIKYRDLLEYNAA
jgi:hypothetical protein